VSGLRGLGDGDEWESCSLLRDWWRDDDSMSGVRWGAVCTIGIADVIVILKRSRSRHSVQKATHGPKSRWYDIYISTHKFHKMERHLHESPQHLISTEPALLRPWNA